MLTILALSTAVQAADLTDTPTFMGADVGFDYSYSSRWLTLMEGSEEVATSQQTSSALAVEGQVGLQDWAALTFSVPFRMGSSIGFWGASTMAWDPVEDHGSMVIGDEIEGAIEGASGSGLGGMSFGLTLAPFQERKGAKVTHTLSISRTLAESAELYAVPDGSTLMSGDASATLLPPPPGSNAGAANTTISTAFSTTLGNALPYISISWVDRDAITVNDVELERGDSVGFITGTEIVNSSNEATGASYSTKLWAGVAYHGFSELLSGLYLPSVVYGTEGTVVRSDEHIEYLAGFGGHWVMLPALAIDFGLEVSSLSKGRVESAYPIETGLFTPAVSGNIGMTFRYR